jgi:hypothetical protein
VEFSRDGKMTGCRSQFLHFRKEDAKFNLV